MTNSIRGAVPFEVDGEQLYLRLTTNAQVRYQDASGESLAAGLKALTEMVKGSEDEPADEHAILPRVRRIFCAGLSHMPDMTEEKAGDIMDALGQAEAIALMFSAIRAASPQPAGGAEGNARPAKSRKTKVPSAT